MTRKQILELRILDLKDILEYAELNTEGARRALQVCWPSFSPEAACIF